MKPGDLLNTVEPSNYINTNPWRLAIVIACERTKKGSTMTYNESIGWNTLVIMEGKLWELVLEDSRYVRTWRTWEHI